MMKIKNKKINNIVIIRSNPVDPDSRVEKEANSLAKSDYQVKLLVWNRSVNKIYEDSKQLPDAVIPRINLGFKATYGEGVKNLKSFILFQFNVFRWIIKNRKDIDVVHACDFDTAFISLIACKLLNIRLVFDIFDYIGTKPRNMVEKIVSKLENVIINNANATIICTEQRKNQIHGTKPRLLSIIHNSPAKINFGSLKIKGCKNKIKIVYVGILQDYRMILELAQVVQENEKLELHIGGFGKLEASLIEIVNKTNNIYYYGKLAYSDTLALERQSDIMVALYDPSIGNHYYAAPNKFYEALFLGKPLIMVKNTGMSDVVADNEIGAVINYSKADLKKGIQQLIENKESWGDISYRMKKLFNENYAWERMEERLLNLYLHV